MSSGPTTAGSTRCWPAASRPGERLASFAPWRTRAPNMLVEKKSGKKEKYSPVSKLLQGQRGVRGGVASWLSQRSEPFQQVTPAERVVLAGPNPPCTNSLPTRVGRPCVLSDVGATCTGTHMDAAGGDVVRPTRDHGHADIKVRAERKRSQENKKIDLTHRPPVLPPKGVRRECAPASAVLFSSLGSVRGPTVTGPFLTLVLSLGPRVWSAGWLDCTAMRTCDFEGGSMNLKEPHGKRRCGRPRRNSAPCSTSANNFTA